MGKRRWKGRAAAAGLLVVGALVVLPATPAAASPCDAGTRTIFWTGGGRTNTWFDRLNWRVVATGGPGLPGAADNVCIPNQSPNITVTYDANNATQIRSIEAHEALDISLGSLTINDATQPSTLPKLTVDGGGLGGAAGIGVGASLDFSTGTIGGTGLLTIGQNASMTIGGAGAKVLTRDVTVQGALHWTGGDVGTGQGAVFSNAGKFDVNLGANSSFLFNQGGGAPSIVNAGAFTKGGGTGTATFQGALDNQGTLALSTSTLSVDSLTNQANGAVTVGSGTLLDVAGTLDQAGSVVLPGKSTIAAGTYHQTAGSTALQSTSSAVHSAPGAFTLDGGTLDGVGRVDAALVVNGGTVAPGLSPGILQGTGSYTQNGGTLQIEIAGASPGSGYDRLSLGAGATLGGTLAIDTAAGFTPSVGDSFGILTASSVTGSFGSVTGGTLAGGAFYDVRSNGGAVTLVVVKPAVSVGNVTVAEGNSGSNPASFPLTLSRSSAATVTVTVKTVNGTATAPSDYTATTKTVTFPPGTTSATATVPVNGDTTVEKDETFSLTVTGVTNATVADGTGVATITNDDTKPPPTTP
ncbi:MAG TPA: Calx-beta domain-containing protein, partial [Actinomycetota bacterium]|nr:Calx-beta domain-containing protein [Actinomycetota bacterium]